MCDVRGVAEATEISAVPQLAVVGLAFAAGLLSGRFVSLVHRLLRSVRRHEAVRAPGPAGRGYREALADR